MFMINHHYLQIKVIINPHYVQICKDGYSQSMNTTQCMKCEGNIY